MTYPWISDCTDLQRLRFSYRYDGNHWLDDLSDTIMCITPSKHSQRMRLTVDVRLENYIRHVADSEEALRQKWQHWGSVINERPSVSVIVQVIHDDLTTAEFDVFLRGIEQAYIKLDGRERLEVHFLNAQTMDENDRWV